MRKRKKKEIATIYAAIDKKEEEEEVAVVLEQALGPTQPHMFLIMFRIFLKWDGKVIKKRAGHPFRYNII